MVHSRCSATAASAVDRDATLPDSAAGNATGLVVVVARTLAVAAIANPAIAVTAAGRSRHGVADPGASCCCRDAGRPVAGSNHDSAVVASKRPAGPGRDVFALPGPDGSDRSSDPVAVAADAAVPSAGGPGSVAVAADAAVPSAGDPGSVVAAADAAAPSAVADPGSVAVAADAV